MTGEELLHDVQRAARAFMDELTTHEKDHGCRDWPPGQYDCPITQILRNAWLDIANIRDGLEWLFTDDGCRGGYRALFDREYSSPVDVRQLDGDTAKGER